MNVREGGGEGGDGGGSGEIRARGGEGGRRGVEKLSGVEGFSMSLYTEYWRASVRIERGKFRIAAFLNRIVGAIFAGGFEWRMPLCECIARKYDACV
jgi:hypothetical protein